MAPHSSAKRSYRKRVRSSKCRIYTNYNRRRRLRTCNNTAGCRAASGKKRSFCRKTRNTRRRSGGSRSRRRHQ